MVNLLMRFYELTDGCIKIDGVPTTDIQREDVQRLFGMVLQDTWLFEGTVRENLVYNLAGVTDAQLETVCRACGLDKFVHSLPEGFDTVLSESTSISAGQKQLLTIARAMLQNAPMLILDEATSSVDTRTELLIQRAMDRADGGPHELRHRPPPLDDQKRRPHPRHEGRRRHRKRHPRHRSCSRAASTQPSTTASSSRRRKKASPYGGRSYTAPCLPL